MGRVVRIGNAQAFWGDRPSAAAEMLALEPDLDFLTLDYLAEVSMSILARQKERDPSTGYARDFVEVVRSLAHYWDRGGRCRVIANAGGLNPLGCARACINALQEACCRPMKVGVVTGDDVLAAIRDGDDANFRNLDNGAPISNVRDRLVTANAYLGAAPIVEALRQGAEIVITGRVADPSLTLAPCIYQLGWSPTDWDRLAAGTVAGHLIECGTQVTGGISTEWLDIPDATHLGFPIVEVSDDGEIVVTKTRGSGGVVNEWTVKEQLLYEIGDPAKYLSPDVSVSFLSLTVEDLGSDRVRVLGALGGPPPPSYKVSATHRDGYRAAGTLTLFGRDAVAKARRAGEMILRRLADDGCEFCDSLVECLGSGSCVPGVLSKELGDAMLETVLRIAVASDRREDVDKFSRELMALVTAGPQGATGYAEGRPQVQPVFRYWPCLIEQNAVQPRFEIIESSPSEGSSESDHATTVRYVQRSTGVLRQDGRSTREKNTRTLRDRAIARSGDKGINANIGVIARTAEDYEYLDVWLTADRMRSYFLPMGLTSVERFELPNLRSFNFILRGILTSNLRTDAQGKTLGQALLEMPLE